MAHLLRAQFRENEGEFIGALLLYRKAAEAYDPEAHDQLTSVFLKIYQYEATMLNRPVAARAALERAVHFQPADAELRTQLADEFGPDGPYPAAASKKYAFRPTAKPVPEAAATGRYSDARKAFEDLTQLTPDDPAAWFNLGVVLAWMGEQPKAVAALVKSIELETDDYRAEEAGALAEVLRCGYGMENDTDHLAHAFVMPIRDPQPVQRLLQVYVQNGKLRGMRQNRETGVMVGALVEELPSLIAVGSVALARVAARLMIGHGAVRLSHPNRDSVAKVADDIRTELQLAVEQPVESTTPLNFGDVVLEAARSTDRLRRRGRTRSEAQRLRHALLRGGLDSPAPEGAQRQLRHQRRGQQGAPEARVRRGEVPRGLLSVGYPAQAGRPGPDPAEPLQLRRPAPQARSGVHQRGPAPGPCAR